MNHQHNTFVYSDIGIEVIELSPSEWRVSDTRGVNAGDGLALIGFIQQTTRGYEVTELGAPGKRTSFATFQEALMLLSKRCTDRRLRSQHR